VVVQCLPFHRPSYLDLPVSANATRLAFPGGPSSGAMARPICLLSRRRPSA